MPNPKMCKFHASQVEFLGSVISPSGVSMDASKVAAVTDWPCPGTVKEVQSFLALQTSTEDSSINSQRLRIRCTKANPLHELSKNGIDFLWGERYEHALNTLKESMSTAPVLQHYDLSLPITRETDALDYALGAIL